MLVGGRLGFVLFYEPGYFLSHPLDVVAVWQGGMSSHGGFLGVTLALLYALRERRNEWLKLADIIVIPIAIGLALGRLGNFINQELYGIPTNLPWGIEIPGEEGLRHPTQIYAFLKDLFVAAVCFWHLKRGERGNGRTLALFLILYGVLRFLLEYLRVQEYPMIDTEVLLLSRGQVLTIPIFFTGVFLWWWGRKRS